MQTLKFSDEEIVEKFLSLCENDFSKKILLPLFEEIYKSTGKVNFIGGKNEKGKDLIIEMTDQLLSETVIAIQVKKVKWSSNSSNSSMQTLNTQMQQAFDEPIISSDCGHEKYVNRFIAITPYIITPDVLDHHRNSFQKAVRGKQVDFFDGKKIINLIRKSKPDILANLFGRKEVFRKKLYEKLDHEELKIALGLSNIKSLKDIYCTSNILTGGNHNNHILNSDIVENKNNIINIERSNINKIIELNNEINLKFKTSIIDESTLKDIEKTDSDIESFNRSIKSIINTSKIISISDKKYQANTKSKLEKIKNLSEKKEFKILLNHIHSILQEKSLSKTNKENINKLKTQLETYSFIKEKIENDNIPIKITLKPLLRKLEKKKSDLRKTKNISENLKSYLINTEEISKLISAIMIFKSIITVKETKKDELKPPQISITDVFNTGLNIAILGEAGTGKTTNLKNYARQLLNNNKNLTFFSTLSDICRSCNNINSKNIKDGLVNEYQKLSESISENDITYELENNQTHIILDSIDEAISDNNWIIESIKKFSEDYPKAQIIISSRYSINEINEIPFCHIDLLPFNIQQRNEFLSKWFNNKRIVNQIIDHLEENKSLSDIVVNPLSATILCTLKENSITLPRNEYELYNERFNLLSGKFDIAKRIKRLDSSSDILLSAAEYSALKTHIKKSREFSELDLKKYIKESQRNNDDTSIEIIYKDLIKSEIIIKNHYNIHSFGHLKFQEYLASREILSDREFKIRTLFTSPWWHEVMLLCAKGSRDITWIINYAVDNEVDASNFDILNRIINECEDNETTKNILRRKINTLKFEDHDFDTINDDFLYD